MEPVAPLPLSRKKKIVFTITAAVLLLAFFELVARLFLNNNSAISVAERKNSFEPYQNKPWTEQYFKDEVACAEQRKQGTATSSFARYLVYDAGYPECFTPTINYLDGTRRKTWNPEHDSARPGLLVREVAFFGGSTVQGAGVPDDLTIPSVFSQLANSTASNVVYHVENYGVSGYTHTQAIVKLILLLREGKKFDYVVMYNGANDIDNAYEAGKAGAIYGEKTVENRLYGGLWGQAKEKVKDQLTSCGLCRLVITTSRHTPFLKDYLTPLLVQTRKFLLFKEGATKSEEDLVPFAQGIADNYSKSHELLDRLSRAYGFTYFDFWQPSLHYEEGPVGGEQLYWSIDNRLTDEKLKSLFLLTLENIRAAKLNNFYDLSTALADRTKAYYLDAVHISDEGNAVVAQRIFETFKKNQ
jgi:lysophospholipase L1-like esterase